MKELVLVVMVILGAAAHASAQRPVMLEGRKLVLTPSDQAVFDSIHAESQAATCLLVLTAIEGAAALATLLGALFAAMADAATLFHAGYIGATEGLLIGAAVTGGLLAVTLPIGIALSVDARSRRNALSERVTLSLGPSGLGFSGRF